MSPTKAKTADKNRYFKDKSLKHDGKFKILIFESYAIHYIVLRVHNPKISGGYNEKVTPVPIPNTVVKLLSADDTWLVTARESKSLPDLYQSPVLINTGLCAMCAQYGEIEWVNVPSSVVKWHEIHSGSASFTGVINRRTVPVLIIEGNVLSIEVKYHEIHSCSTSFTCGINKTVSVI